MRCKRAALLKRDGGGEQVFFFFDAGEVCQAHRQGVVARVDVCRAHFGGVKRVIRGVFFYFLREKAHQRVKAVDDFFVGFGFVGDFVAKAAGFALPAGKGGFAAQFFPIQVAL